MTSDDSEADPNQHDGSDRANRRPWDGNADWPVLGSGRLAETPYFTTGYDDVRRPDGQEARYFWIDPDDAVVVVAHDRTTDELVLVEQYRPKLRRRFCELPGGGVDDGKSPEAAARRELREETGVVADRLERLGAYHPSGYNRMTRHVWYATQLTDGEPDHDPGELITVRRRDADRVLTEARESISPGWTLTPLLWARNADLL